MKKDMIQNMPPKDGKMLDLAVIMVSFFKDEMIEESIIPKDVKWSKLTKKQQNGVKKFINKKIKENSKKQTLSH